MGIPIGKHHGNPNRKANLINTCSSKTKMNQTFQFVKCHLRKDSEQNFKDDKDRTGFCLKITL